MSDPMPGKPQDFIIRAEGLNLDEKARQRIAGALQAAFVAELGNLDIAAKGGTLAYIPRREWLGFWLRNVAQLKDQGFNHVLNVTERNL